MSTAEGSLNIDRIVDEVLDAMYGYTRHQEQVTALSAGIDASQTSLTVAESNLLSRGLIEIDNEQMLVKTVDTVGGTVTLQPFGRGVNNTTAAVHALNAKVTMSPLYTRRRVRDVIYGVVREIWPDIYSVAQTTLDTSIVRTNYPLPVDCYQVLTVEWLVPGPSQMWEPLRRWRMNQTPTTTEVELIGPFFPGQDRVRIMYIKTLPADITDDNVTTLGFTQHIHDILVLGATSRLLYLTEPSRLQVDSVVSHGRAEVVPAGQLKSLATDLYRLFQHRVQQESNRLQERYAARPHIVR